MLMACPGTSRRRSRSAAPSSPITRADHRQQLAVAEAHALALEHVVIEVGDEPDEQIAGRGADGASSQGTSCAPKAARKKIGIAGSVMASGSSLVSRSMNASTTSAPAKAK